MFDLKMGRIYFDARLQGGKRSPLLQLYHQEGIRAIISTLRKGFEDLHEAKFDLHSIVHLQKDAKSEVTFGGVHHTQSIRRDNGLHISAKGRDKGDRYLQLNRSKLSYHPDPEPYQLQR